MMSPSMIRLVDRVNAKFKEIDSNKDGYLDNEELSLALDFLGFNWTHDQVKAFISAIDRNGDGLIDSTEFRIALMGALAANPRQDMDDALRTTVAQLQRKAKITQQLE